MRFLLPTGGVTNYSFGIMTTPAHKAIPQGIRSGMRWAADNEAFTRGFDPGRFFAWLHQMEPYKSTCLFIPVPDVLGDALATLNQWRNWVVRFDGWPLAFVAQDGQENLPYPDESTFAAVFIGGSTRWKKSQAAIDCIRRGQAMWKHVHIGRVNWGERYRGFRILKGSESFTCDGTRTRYEGARKTIKAWSAYQAQPPLMAI